ncbi:MAG: hypothetical protein R2849_09875 [Thermomicrobiales bacterium]
MIALLLVSGIGLVIRQLTADAAPVSDISARISRYTGSVRMS